METERFERPDEECTKGRFSRRRAVAGLSIRRLVHGQGRSNRNGAGPLFSQLDCLRSSPAAARVCGFSARKTVLFSLAPRRRAPVSSLKPTFNSIELLCFYMDPSESQRRGMTVEVFVKPHFDILPLSSHFLNLAERVNGEDLATSRSKSEPYARLPSIRVDDSLLCQ